MSTANWLAIAKAQAGLQGVPVKAGEGRVSSVSAWDVVVELRSPQDRVVIAKFDRTRGNWVIH